MATEGPVIVVHKGWRPFKTQRLKVSKSPVSNKDEVESLSSVSVTSGSSASKGYFEFINTTKPGQTREAGLQRRVRKHARNQRTGGVKSSSPDQPPQFLHNPQSINNDPEVRPHVSQPSIPPPLGNETSLSIFAWPIEMQPRTHLLLGHYLTYASSRMFSLESILESNPLRNPEWFQYAATDAAMMHAMLYSGSVYMCLFDRGTWSGDVVFHQMRTVGIVGERLKRRIGGNRKGVEMDMEEDIEDSTLGAISCLALGEAVMGNKEMWSMHMMGLKQVLSVKGRLGGLSPLMKAKLRRSDVTGAIDYGATPYLNIERSSTVPIWSILPLHKIQTTSQAITSILTRCSISPSLIATMINMSFFSQTIRLAKLTPGIKLDPIAFSEDIYAIERDLLLASESDQQDLEVSAYEPIVSNSLRIGALLYVKSILHEFPHSVIGPSILLSQLQTSINSIPLDFATSAATRGVLQWLGTIGVMLAQTEDIRDWWLAFLRGMFDVDGFDGESWDIYGQENILRDLLSLEDMWDVRMEVDQVWRRLGRASVEEG